MNVRREELRNWILLILKLICLDNHEIWTCATIYFYLEKVFSMKTKTSCFRCFYVLSHPNSPFWSPAQRESICFHQNPQISEPVYPQTLTSTEGTWLSAIRPLLTYTSLTLIFPDTSPGLFGAKEPVLVKESTTYSSSLEEPAPLFTTASLTLTWLSSWWFWRLSMCLLAVDGPLG